MKAVALASILAVSFSFSVWLGQNFGNATEKKTLAPVNLLRNGHIDSAMRQAERLLFELKSHGWDGRAVNFSLRRLPDQDFAEIPMQRDPRIPSFVTPGLVDIYDREVAFFSSLYVRRNYQRGPSSEGIVSRPEGFFIVGWKDGRVTQVPVEQVRLYRCMLPDGPIDGPKTVETFQYVFPGMSIYRPSLPSFPGVSKPERPASG